MAVPNWSNQTIWTGDCLEILRGMNAESVDLIYLDPPFNSKANYAAPIGSKAAGAAFKDSWNLSDVDAEWINLIEAKHPALYRVLLAAMTGSDKSYLAYMAARLIEMRRVLKPTGSLYLHCDPTMSHYLKLVLDALARDLPGGGGRFQFRNEIVWERTAGRKSGRQFGRAHDTLLFYSCEANTWNAPTIPQTEETARGHSLMRDSGGMFRLSNFSAPGSGPPRQFGDREIAPPAGRHWMYDQAGIDALIRDGRIRYSRNGQPGLKRYLKDLPGISVRDVWSDVSPINSQARERIGYPTQKPLALLDRIIAASSNPGDVVLDPFCGCATACIAAEQAGREWVGIDISPKAADLVRQRMRDELGMFYEGAHRTDIPKRTDLGKLPPYNCAANRKALYGEQGGDCAGCDDHFEPRHLEVDHIIARKRGGTDHLGNLQLLCGNCNRIKGDRGMEYLRAKLQLPT